MHFHGNKLEELHKFIPRDYLPANYGGNLPEMDYSSKDWYPIFRDLDDYIKGNFFFYLFFKRFRRGGRNDWKKNGGELSFPKLCFNNKFVSEQKKAETLSVAVVFLWLNSIWTLDNPLKT